MEKSFYYKPGSQVITVPEDIEIVTDGLSQKQLLKNAEISVTQLHLSALQALPEGASDYDRFYIVLDGEILVKPASNEAANSSSALHTLTKEALVHIPRKIDCASRLRAGQTDALLLEVQIPKPKAKPKSLKLDQGIWIDEQFLIIEKLKSRPYIPDHHVNTSNHCLFINDDIEILLSCIDVGGGADVHTHEGEDQCTYVIEPAPSKLLYYPKGVQHGGITNIEKRHDLILMYFPPQGECLEPEISNPNRA